MEDLAFFDASELDTNVKATVHLNGRLGFNKNAEKKLSLPESKFVRIARKPDYDIDKTLYLVPTREGTKDAFPVLKSGEYYYAATKSLFDFLGEDYENVKIIYDITEVQSTNGTKIFKLKRRDIERKKDTEEM
jgi:hypothetical protein